MNTAAALAQFNNMSFGGCIRIVKQLFDSHIPTSAKFIGGELFSHSGKGPCKRTYNKLEKKTGFSKSTIGRSLKSLKDNNYISALEQSTYTYIRDEKTGDRYYRFPEFLMGKKLKIKGEPEERELTPNEELGFAFIFTSCDNSKRNSNSFTTSNARFAKLIHCSERTAASILKTLLHAGLLTRPAEDKGVNKNKLSTYHVNFKYLRELQNGNKKPKSEPMTRAEVESILAERRNAAEHRAENIRALAMQDKQYGDLTRQMNDLSIKAAFLELKDKAAALKLQKEYATLERRADARLALIGIDKADLKPKYYCRECNDTGNKPNGERCYCYRRE